MSIYGEETIGRMGDMTARRDKGTEPVRIAHRLIGPGYPTFIIAEAGVNHNGDRDMAKKLVEAAAEAGSDAVKFQTFTADSLTTKTVPKAKYQEAGDTAKSQHEMLKKLELPRDVYQELHEFAKQLGIIFLSTPFDESSVDLLVELQVPAIKAGSGELTNLPLLAYIGSKGLPVLLSTGMGTLGEVEEALEALGDVQQGVLLFHCTSAYPVDANDVNLRAMETLRLAFQCPVGYSDHTNGIATAVAAVALGAAAIEKHLTLDRSLPGPDHRTSLEPAEFRAMVQGIRQVEKGLGMAVKRPSPAELEMRKVSRKSVVAVCDIAKGSRISADMVAIKRPGTGISPRYLGWVVGRVASGNISADDVVSWDCLEL